MCASFPFGFECVVSDLIVLLHDYRLSFYFADRVDIPFEALHCIK